MNQKKVISIEKMKILVKMLKNRKETVTAMESCTGGLFASEITNVSR